MTFQFSSTPGSSKWMTVVPIMADQHREQELSLIAKSRNIEPEILIQGFKADFCEILPLTMEDSHFSYWALGKSARR